MNRTSILCVVAALAPLVPFARGDAPAAEARGTNAAPVQVTIAHWNVENLFDAEDDPDNKGDDEYTPRGWTRWTEARYRLKLTNLADIVSCMKPDILSMAEVENRRVLKDLSEVLDHVYGWPMTNIVHKDSPDQRGIDCAMISLHKPTRVTWIKTYTGQRESPMVDFEIAGRRLTVIGNHWKSRWGEKKVSDAVRSVMAEKVRRSYLHVLSEDPAAAILVTGDFNDNMDDPIPQESGGFCTNLAEVLSGEGTNLFCLSSLLPPDRRGTFFYSQTKTWNSFDTMNVSRGLLEDGSPASPWVVLTNRYEVFVEERQRMGEYGAPFPFRRVGTRDSHKIYSGYSDHFPIRVTLEAREPPAP